MNNYTQKKYPFESRFYWLFFEAFDPIVGKKEDDWYAHRELLVEADNIFEYIGWMTWCYPVATRNFRPIEISEERFNELIATGVKRG